MTFPGNNTRRASLVMRAGFSCLLCLILFAGCGEEGMRGPDTDSQRAASGTSPLAIPGGAPPFLIVYVSLDTLRADRLEAYGYERATAPGLSALAEESIVFLNVAAQASQTLLSHKSLFTGMYPLRLAHQVTGASLETLASLARPTDVAARVFTDVPITLPQLLKQAGYRTVSFTGGGWMGRNMGFAEGFDVFDDKSSDKGKSFRRAFRWLRRNEITAEQPTFLFVHAYDIHCPFVSRAPYDTLFCNNHERHAELVDNCAKPTLLRMQLGPEELQAISDHYDGGIASADAYLGEIIGLIKELGLYEEALIIVTSDHGDSFGEHEQIGHGGLYFEQLMVPLIMKLPASWGIVPARVEGGVELVDVMPTLLESAGVSVPPDLDGRSLLPVMAGAASTRRYLRAQITFREGKESISSLGKRAILEPSKWLVIHDVASAESEAFDLHTDRAGLTDVGADRPEDVQALLDVMLQRDRAMTTGASVQFATPAEAFRVEPLEEQLDSSTIEQLRSLGYID